ncbi:hypothetical protein EVAR_46352_1 [Eumeta japonica]|uniref:Uncharacterized protein n=1 Tax=Eumeta variegata TaxID=151549 RepID=A0A4C1WU41_EUMVA|nr:hypothetical protein EVAR_46352_1 [Eumeta japonica]
MREEIGTEFELTLAGISLNQNPVKRSPTSTGSSENDARKRPAVGTFTFLDGFAHFVRFDNSDKQYKRNRHRLRITDAEMFNFQRMEYGDICDRGEEHWIISIVRKPLFFKFVPTKTKRKHEKNLNRQRRSALAIGHEGRRAGELN